MRLTRREALALSAGAAALVLAGGRAGPALATAEDADAAIMKFTDGTRPQTGRITLTAPEIAENGNTVPISVSVESPMTAEDHVSAVLILADGNPNPAVAMLHFTPRSGTAAATTRIRLAQTQNVVAVARMSDGSVYMDRKEVKVTIGGCGG